MEERQVEKEERQVKIETRDLVVFVLVLAIGFAGAFGGAQMALRVQRSDICPAGVALPPAQGAALLVLGPGNVAVCDPFTSPIMP